VGDYFHVGAHHGGDAAGLGVSPQVVCGRLARPPSVFQRLQRHVQADLVAVLEAVHDRLGRTVHPQLHAVAQVLLDARHVDVAGHLNHLDRRIADPGYVAAARHGDPDLARQLRGQLVELQRCEQTEDGLRHLGGDGRETLEFRSLRIRQAVQTAPDPFQNASGGQARENDPGRIDGVQIDGAQQPLLAGQIEDALGVGGGEHGVSVFRLFAQCNF